MPGKARRRPTGHLGLSPGELVRYARHLALPEVGSAGQRRLKASSALVVGLGGLGNPAAAYLAAAGVGRIGLVDGDDVERSNLHRQFLFTEADVGQNKAEVARRRLLAINPSVGVKTFPVRLISSNAMRVISGFDVVVDSTDNLPSRYLISDACVLGGKPDVYASALGFDGQASVFHPPRGPCYRCLYPTPPPPEGVESCEDAGVLGVVPGVMGTVQALQVLTILLGVGPSLLGRLLVFSGLDSSFEELRIKRDPDCPACGQRPTIRKLIDYEAFCGAEPERDDLPETTPKELKASLGRARGPVLLDVREPYEHEICRIAGSKLIPLKELGRRLGELDRSREIVVYCHHGRRSAAAVRLLRRAGYRKAMNLKGGIEAWAELVDHRMARY